MTVKLINDRKGTEREFDNRADAEDQKNKLIELGMDSTDLEIVETPSEEPQVVEDPNPPETVQDKTKVEPSEQTPDVVELSKDPIGFLESVNTDFVNTIKGKPAISKQGFRFIQREFGITTEAEVVEFVDDPTGVVVWAKASLPDGHSAEAHGEGWMFESDVDDNEFVRYADTRAKNRALSDLTSAGALAVSELTGEE